MKPALRGGRLIEPASFLEGVKRRVQIEIEAQKIVAQLADESRPMRAEYADFNVYADWRARAQRALTAFRFEAKLLEDWVARHDKLLKDAHELLRRLEDEVDFESDEAALVRKLDAYLGTAGNGGSNGSNG